MSDPVERAAELFAQGCSCSQAVFVAYAPELGMPLDQALKVAAGFGGGMGRCGETCGAVSGGVMVLGLRHGSGVPGDRAAKERTYEIVHRFVEAFRARHGAVDCRDLLGVSIDTPEGQQQAREQGLFKSVCPQLVRDAAELVAPFVV
jgi:C_GCAxxG_C_C family probable redox protein